MHRQLASNPADKEGCLPQRLEFLTPPLPWVWITLFSHKHAPHDPPTPNREGFFGAAEGTQKNSNRNGGGGGRKVQSGSPPAPESEVSLSSQLDSISRSRNYRGGDRRKGKRQGGDTWRHPSAFNPCPPPFLARAGWRLGEPTDLGVFKRTPVSRLLGAKQCLDHVKNLSRTGFTASHKSSKAHDSIRVQNH